MDLAFETARGANADLVIANDPDADRLAVAVPDPHAHGGWRRLTGNQIGLLLGWRAARLAPRRRALARCVARLLARLLARTQSGRRALRTRLPRDPHRLQVDLARARARLRLRRGSRLPREPRDGARQGRHLGGHRDAGAGDRGARPRARAWPDVLAEFDATFGFFASDQISIRVDDLSRIDTDHGRRCGSGIRIRSAVSASRRSRTSARAWTICRRETCCGCGLADGSRRDRAPERHRAEAEGLPRRAGRLHR